jgi:uncharacterized membrane protein
LGGFDLHTAASNAYDVPPEKRGTPLMVLGDTVLAGEDEIRARLDEVLDDAFAAGGTGFPEPLGLTDQDLTVWRAVSAEAHLASPEPDPVANAMALAVLGGMIASLVYVGGQGRRLTQHARASSDRSDGLRLSLAVPALVGGGLVVSGYLGYLKLTQSDAICPIGNCSAVQHSPYALLFGVPVAYLGFLSYAALLALWIVGAFGSGRWARLAPFGVVALSVFGTAFSAYLTLLEPFVIREVCIWCLLSAVIMTGIALVATREVLGAVVVSARPRAATRPERVAAVTAGDGSPPARRRGKRGGRRKRK